MRHGSPILVRIFFTLTWVFIAVMQILTSGERHLCVRLVHSMRSQSPTQRSADAAPDHDVVARGKCRCALVWALRTEDGWLLTPAVTRGFRVEAILLTRKYDSILMERNVDDWDSPSPLRVWCRHGVSSPNVAEAVRRWRPRHLVA